MLLGEKLMKKCPVVFAAILVLAAFVPAPVAAAIKFDLGLKAGVSQAKIREAFSEPSYEVAYSDSLTRPVFGAFAAVNLSRFFAIQPEIYLLTKGGKWPDDGIMVPETFSLRYIHVPILAKFRLINKGKLIPVIFAGPSWDILLSARDMWYFDGEWHLWPLPASYKSTVGGFVLGVGVEYMLDRFLLILDIRNNLGLAHIGIEGPHEWGKTRALMFMVGVGF